MVGVVISLYYYFGVIRTIYWAEAPAELPVINVSLPARISIGVCVYNWGTGKVTLTRFPGLID